MISVFWGMSFPTAWISAQSCGPRKSFADGKVWVPYSHFLGYERGPDGGLVVNEEQAKTVKLIYRLFLSGLSFHSVARELEKRGIKSPRGKDNWSQGTVKSILTNEKYKGDALLQKNFTVDFLTKKQKKNEGEVPQYYVENNHEAIIPRETFELVQEEIARRCAGGRRHSGTGIFSGKIKCGDCGSWYGSKVWHSTDAYRKTIYQCNRKFDNSCGTPHLTEDEIKAAFVRALNSLLSERDEIEENISEICGILCDNSGLETERGRLEQELAVIVEMTQNAVAENARVAQDQKEYRKRYDGLVRRYEDLKAQHEKVTEQIAERLSKRKRLTAFADIIREQDVIAEFDEALWASLVDFMTVKDKDDVRVTFKDGTEIKA